MSKNILTIVAVMSFGFAGTAFATNPRDNCNGPNQNGSDHCQGGDKVIGVGAAGDNTTQCDNGICSGKTITYSPS